MGKTKWWELALQLLIWLLPGNGGKGKLDEEVEVLKTALKLATSELPKEKKGEILLKAVGDLKAVKGYTDRVSKRYNKAKDRILGKLGGLFD